jgi:hypothetical protein
MRRRNRAIAVVCGLTVLVTGAVAVPMATAAGGNPIINDCEANGQLTHTFTLAELRHALAVMPASVKQYTNCYDVIQQALIQARKTGTAGPGSSSGSGGSFLPTPVIIVIVVLLVGAAGFGAMALVRRRRGGGGGGPGPGGPSA